MIDTHCESAWFGEIAVGFHADGEIRDGWLTGHWPDLADGGHVLLATHREGEPCWALLARADLDSTLAAEAVAVDTVFARPDGYPSAVGAAAASAVVAAADAAWRGHVEQVRVRLAASYGATEVTDQPSATSQVAWAASDIDAAALQIEVDDSARAHRQAVVRVRGAVDHLLGYSRRHGLDASDPVTRLWRDVHTGTRATLRLIDALEAGSG